MIKQSILALASLAIALTAQAAPPVTITYLPFTISAPGTYILAKDFTFSDSGTAINILPLPSPAGPVILDLKGHTITGPGLNSQNAAIVVGGGNFYPVTIRNGTLSNFHNDIAAGGGVSPANTVTIDSMIFNLPTQFGAFGSGGSGVSFDGAFNCRVKDCTFIAESSTDRSGSSGITDDDPQGGNSYENNTFNGVTNPFAIVTDFDTGIDQIVLDNAKYSPLKKK